LVKNIQSVEAQTLKNYEHVFIDGGSKDRTREIINTYEKKSDAKVKLIVDLKKGVSVAFNRGIKEAGGKYLIFLNSDDYFFDNNVLRDAYNYLQENADVDWIYGKINLVEIDGKSAGVFPTKKIFQTSNNFILKFINYIPHQAVFIKKEVFEKYGNFDTSLKVNMDTDLWLRIAPCTKWKFLDRIVSSYTLRSDSLTSGIKNKATGLRTLEKVKARYLNRFELFFAKIGDQLVAGRNKTYR
jgi:glycosyltransferase involved in cell wall biosynthesis